VRQRVDSVRHRQRDIRLGDQLPRLAWSERHLEPQHLISRALAQLTIMDLTVADNLGEAQYEARLNGEVGGTLEYELTEDSIILVHTSVKPEHEDQGIGGRLARFAFDDARSRGLRVQPVCSFVRSWLERHPENSDLVD